MYASMKTGITFFIVVLCVLLPLGGYAGIVENIKSSCPSDPTQNGRCALEEIIEDGYSCRDIEGQEVCRDWWKKEYHYKCGGSFDPDTILLKVGNSFCEYVRECSNWTDLEKSGGITSCRTYIDLNRPGCDEGGGTATSSCLADDCGDLFDRCTMKQYVNYGNIQDRANLADDINCDPASGTCSEEILEGSLSGKKLGVYTFQCPLELKKICTSYTDTLKCPDGRNQLCNKTKTCVAETDTISQVKTQKSCSADRQFQTHSILKYITGSKDLTPEEIAKDANPMCIKIGEIGTCDTEGCSNINSYGVRYWVRYGGTMDTLDGMNAWDWGYAKIWGQGSGQIRVVAFATGLEGYSGGLDLTIPTSTAPGTFLGLVHPHWESSYQNIEVYYDGYTCSDGSCVHTIRFVGMGAATIFVPVTRIESQYNCFSNNLQIDCNFPPELACVQLSDTTDLDSLECLLYEMDMNALDTLCKRYVIQYECSEEKTTTDCSEYKEVLVCGNVVYPIPNVSTKGEDHTGEFGMAMALAQATNELKHVWTGKAKLCESGLWWLFDNMDIAKYLASKIMSFAIGQLGGALFSQVSGVIGDSVGCAATPAVAAIKYGTATGGAASFIDDPQTQKSIGDCFSNKAVEGMGNLGLSAAQATQFLQFMGNPLVQFVVSVIIDIVSSIEECSTCEDEQCSKDHQQYEAFALISNKLCHFVGSDCTWKGAFDDCLRTGYKYCCYDSLFARILVEQAYMQKEYSFGYYDEPNCGHLTFDDLRTLDFDSMDFTEFIASLEAKMKGVLDEEKYKQKIRDSMDSSLN